MARNRPNRACRRAAVMGLVLCPLLVGCAPGFTDDGRQEAPTVRSLGADIDAFYERHGKDPVLSAAGPVLDDGETRTYSPVLAEDGRVDVLLRYFPLGTDLAGVFRVIEEEDLPTDARLVAEFVSDCPERVYESTVAAEVMVVSALPETAGDVPYPAAFIRFTSKPPTKATSCDETGA